MLQTKKSIKKDIVKQSLAKTPSPPRGSIFFFGKIGSGKTLAMLGITQRFNGLRNNKVFDAWGGERNQGENLYWGIPLPYKIYSKYITKKFRLNEEYSKQYRVDYIYVYVKGMRDYLPYLPEYVFSEVVRIPFKLIETKHIKMVIGNLSNDDETIWGNIVSDLRDNDGIPELIKQFEKKNATKRSIYKNFFYF